MIIANSIEEIALKGCCVSIGSFDGVHLGHRALIANLVSSAKKRQVPSVVLTFFPHPVVVLKQIEAPFYLSTPQEKAEILSSLGVDVLVSQPFTRELADMSAFDFMKLLYAHTALQELIVGCGFTMGKNRSGTVETLTEMGKTLGFEVNCISSEKLDGDVISSSQIRKMIEQGDVQSSTALLGRPYEVHGTVIRGDGRGRTIGFPTANLDAWPQKLLPSVGVYRCTTRVDGMDYFAVGNVGYRPTFTDNTKDVFVEIHLLDYKGDLYGRELQVKFTHRLRGEVKFASFEELVHQIHCDIKTAREL